MALSKLNLALCFILFRIYVTDLDSSFQRILNMLVYFCYFDHRFGKKCGIQSILPQPYEKRTHF